MIPQLKRTRVTTLLFLGLALVLCYAGFLLQEKIGLLEDKNQHYQSILKRLKTVHFPEQFISFLKDMPQESAQEILTRNAKAHYISLEKINTSLDQEGLQTIEITFSAELDTDVFHYIQEINRHYKNNPALKEVGLFQGETGITGKMTFKAFKPKKAEKGNFDD